MARKKNNEGRVQAEYRCRWCRGGFSVPLRSRCKPERLMKFLGTSTALQELTRLHECDFGSGYVGLADLIGYRVVIEPERKEEDG